jgi:serine/threonine-protein kinase
VNGDLWSLIEALGEDERRNLFTSLQRSLASPGNDAAPALPSAPAGQSPSPDDRYQVIDRIGAGGMGTVHRVLDRTLLRESAMKVMARALATQPEHAQRFTGEAQIQAQLDHPHIVPVHDLSTEAAGVPSFTMRLLRGVTLGEWIRRAKAENTLRESSHEMLSAFLKVCDAVSFAHHRGVVHGDIKPENVVVEGFGAVYLVDWGLARLLGHRDGPGPEKERVRIGEDARRVLSGAAVAGTPAFMAPEQAHGLSELIDERTDVFGLGGLLHTILTGRPPHVGRTLAEVRESAKPPAGNATGRTSVVEESTLVGPGDLPLPGAIRNVVLRALAVDREDRYGSVVELKRDVERFLRGDLAWPLRRYAAGSRIFGEGDPGDAAFVVVDGTCVVYKGTAEAGLHVLREVGPGGTFGEAAVFSAGPRTASVGARTDVVVRVVTREVLSEGLGLDSALGAFVVALARQFRDLDARLAAFDAGRDR